MNDRAPQTVGEAMTHRLVTIHDTALLSEAAQLMDAHRIHGLPVIDARRNVVGMLSQTDLLRLRSIDHLWSALAGLAVRHLMTTPAITVPVSATLDEAAKVMKAHRIHRVVVVAADGSVPVGIFSVTDLIHTMAAEGASVL